MKLSIHWTYRIPGDGHSVILISDLLPAARALLYAKDIEKTGRMKSLEFVDVKGMYWSKKEVEKFLKGIETEPHEITAYFDGGFDRYRKGAGLGVVIYYEKNKKSFRIRKNLYVEHIASNNEAECAALWFLLNELEELGVHHTDVTIKGDSQVVINQLQGDWPCYEDGLNRWLDRIQEKVKELDLSLDLQAIPRNENKEADQLAGQALRGENISGCKDLNEGEQQ